MSKHTRGPWIAKGRNIVTSRETVFTGAVAYAYGEDDNGQDEDECLANARLIAAAPDLYAACEMLLDRTANPITNHAIYSLADARGRALAALAKAEGEAEEPTP